MRDYAIPLFISLTSFLYLFGIDRAVGIGGPYTWPGGDLAQHLSGAYAYLYGEWTFPLFHTNRLNWPDGVNIIFTDSAPIAALFAKAIYSLTGLSWNYLGTWFFITWLGQALSAAFLARAMGAAHWIPMACACVFALSLPAYLMRSSGHLALSSHFLVILALALYFYRPKILPWLILLAVAGLTHAYLLIMSLALFSATIADNMYRGTVEWRQGGVILVSTIAPLIFILWVAGYFNTGLSIDTGGYDYYSMNLLSPFWPVHSFFFDGHHPGKRGGYEGMNYMGLAGLILVFFAIGRVADRLPAIINRHLFLILLLFGFTLYALSTTIWLGNHKLFSISAPTIPPFTVFRASGRFFWPIAYLALIGAIVLVWRERDKIGRAVTVSFLCSLAFVQAAESRQWFAILAEGSTGQPLSEKVQSFIVGKDHIDVFPPPGCAPNQTVKDKATQIIAFAMRNRLTVNTAHLARLLPSENCQLPSSPQHDTLVIGPKPKAGWVCESIDPNTHLCPHMPPG